MSDNENTQAQFVRWFRDTSPYIHAFRGRTFVIAFGGEMLMDAQFSTLVHDIALLNSLGVRLVLVHGARPQIEERLKLRNADLRYVNGLRVTDATALTCVKDATGSVRIEIEALLSMGLANTPMEKAQIRVISGNYVTAKPLGVRDGVDYLHTGEVREIDTESIHWQLDDNAIVLLSPLGHSPTGEVFNLSAEEIATAAAIKLKADKLILLTDHNGIRDAEEDLIHELTLAEAQTALSKITNESLLRHVEKALIACRGGVGRTHIINRHVDGALLLELFTRDGIGSLIMAENFEDTRQATIDDVGGVLELIKPLENDGVLVRRSRELLEMEIKCFTVVERDGMVIGCAALYPYANERVGELACLAVHRSYQEQGRGDALLTYIERVARQQKINRLFVLTTRTAHWFLERGFQEAALEELPVEKQAMYNYQRRSKVFIKQL